MAPSSALSQIPRYRAAVPPGLALAALLARPHLHSLHPRPPPPAATEEPRGESQVRSDRVSSVSSVGCRWLLAQGRPEEAEAVLLTIARGNGVTAKLDIALQRPAATASCAPAAAESVSALVTQPRLLPVSLILGYCWFVVGGCYYGLTLGTRTTHSGQVLVE